MTADAESELELLWVDVRGSAYCPDGKPHRDILNFFEDAVVCFRCGEILEWSGSED
jgi:hypothetical protein